MRTIPRLPALGATAAALGVGWALLVGLGVGAQSPTSPPPVVVGAGLPTRLPPASGPKSVPVPVGIDGCDRNYGGPDPTRDVCVPLRAPGNKPLTCAYLKSKGYGPLVVRGQDTERLAVPGHPATKGARVC